MASKSLAYVVVLAASVAAAGVGAYVAVRQNARGGIADLRGGAALPGAEPAASRGVTAAASPGGTTASPAANGTPSLSRGQDVASIQTGTASSTSVPPAPAREKTAATRPAARAKGSAPAPAAQTPAAATPSPVSAPPIPNADPASIVPVPPPLPETAPPAAAVVPGEVPPEPQREFEELTVPADSVLGLRLETTVHSERARIEDRVEARVSRDVRVDGRVAIPAGSEVTGIVTLVEHGGKIRNAARIGIRFNSVRLPDGTRSSLATDTIIREGESPANRSAAKIGGAAIGGAILGAILGGGKGAAIGGSIGAAGGTAAAVSGPRNEVILPAGSVVSARLLQPVTVVVEK